MSCESEKKLLESVHTPVWRETARSVPAKLGNEMLTGLTACHVLRRSVSFCVCLRPTSSLSPRLHCCAVGSKRGLRAQA